MNTDDGLRPPAGSRVTAHPGAVRIVTDEGGPGGALAIVVGMRSYPVVHLGLAVLAGSCREPVAVEIPRGGQATPSLVIVNAAVLDVRADVLNLDQTVVIRDGRIVAVGPSRDVSSPPDIERIDAAGAIVMPALIDLHAHGLAADRLAYLGHGIGAVRVMWGTPDQREVAERIERGVDPGPRLVLVSPGHDGTPASWPLTRVVLDGQAAVDAVDRVVREGWSALKVYDRLPQPAYQAILDEATRRGVPVVGHVPFGVDLRDALSLGQRTIEHLSGYEAALAGRLGPNPAGWATVDRNRMPALAAETAAAGTWNTPTLAITAALARRNWPSDAAAIVANRRAMVLALHQAGAHLLIGSDAGIGIVEPGGSLIDEIREFVAAGVPVAEVLDLATRVAADFLGLNIGAIAVGREASLLLLATDPRTNLGTLSRPLGMATGGRWYTESDLAGFRGR